MLRNPRVLSWSILGFNFDFVALCMNYSVKDNNISKPCALSSILYSFHAFGVQWTLPVVCATFICCDITFWVPLEKLYQKMYLANTTCTLLKSTFAELLSCFGKWFFLDRRSKGQHCWHHCFSVGWFQSNRTNCQRPNKKHVLRICYSCSLPRIWLLGKLWRFPASKARDVVDFAIHNDSKYSWKYALRGFGGFGFNLC